MKKAIFVDRDGTIIVEPAYDFQIDSLEKLEFIPGAISGLKALTGQGYELVLASNQDGLGTESYPEHTFVAPHQKMLSTLQGEDVVFDDALIDRHFEHENAPTRKPGTGMFGKYMDGTYDLAQCWVVGDRATDVELARNLGAKSILLMPTPEAMEYMATKGLTATLIAQDWRQIVEAIRSTERVAVVERKSRETDIKLELDLDGRGESKICSGLNFLDHMLEQIVHHGGVSLKLECKGDLHVDEHHTVEDIAIVLGQAFKQALGDKRGVERYGYALPMDECEAMVLLDFGGRIDFRWQVEFRRERVGDVPTEMFSHFFNSFAQEARCNLHIRAEGENDHHKIEGIFKAFARALKAAIRRDVFSGALPSSKGVL